MMLTEYERVIDGYQSMLIWRFNAGEIDVDRFTRIMRKTVEWLEHAKRNGGATI